MITENMKMFLSELRSGKWKQAFGTHRSVDNDIKKPRAEEYCYCAIGLMRQIASPKDFWLVPELSVYYEMPDGILSTMVIWNDVDKLTFPQIADKLEELLST